MDGRQGRRKNWRTTPDRTCKPIIAAVNVHIRTKSQATSRTHDMLTNRARHTGPRDRGTGEGTLQRPGDERSSETNIARSGCLQSWGCVTKYTALGEKPDTFTCYPTQPLFKASRLNY